MEGLSGTSYTSLWWDQVEILITMREIIIEELTTLILRALMEQKRVELPSLGVLEVVHNVDQSLITSEDGISRSIPEDKIIFHAYPTDVIR